MSCSSKWLKVVIGVIIVNQKKLVVATRFGGGSVEFLCYLGGVGFLDEGDEGIEAKGTTCKLLPPLDGGI
jgi:hypothetical protein